MRDLSVCGMKSRSKMCRETEEIPGDGSGGSPEEGSKMGEREFEGIFSM